jgi:hypothetical protein
MRYLCFFFVLCLNSLYCSNVNIDPQRQESNLQNEQSKGLQMKEDSNMQQEQPKGIQLEEDSNLRQERTNDLQFREDLDMKQEKELNRI